MPIDHEDLGQHIPESISYDGTNIEQVAAWARATLRHYEKPTAEVNAISYHRDPEMPMVINFRTQTHNGWMQPGDGVTYNERDGFIKQPGTDTAITEGWARFNQQTQQVEKVPAAEVFDVDPELGKGQSRGDLTTIVGLTHDHPMTEREAASLLTAQAAYSPPSAADQLAARPGGSIFPHPMSATEQASYLRHPVHARPATQPHAHAAPVKPSETVTQIGLYRGHRPR